MKETTAESAALKPVARDALRTALLGHYDRHARDLPWRGDTDPYRILVSEVMLQQTRVETVRGYYDPWLERFPTLEALAVANEDEVLKAWEGLGYYRRARNLHRAARVVRESWDGSLPEGYDALRALPGVGEYTAGAVASIAFGEAVPAVDGNVKRVFARLFDAPEPRPRWLRDRGAELVDESRPGDWNQALMELGATVCTPRNPRCPECPVEEWCASRARGTQLERPMRREARTVSSVDIELAVIHDGRRVLLGKRLDGGLLGGMWAFPEARLDDSRDAGAAGAAGAPGATRAPGGAGRERGAGDEAVAIARTLGFSPSSCPVPLPEVRHRFTHLAARYLPFAVAVEGGIPARSVRLSALARLGIAELAGVEPTGLGDRALPRAQQRVLASWRALHSEAS